MLPNFIIIGAQKSASTFMQRCLSDHPQVFIPKAEIPFFESPEYSPLKINEFEALFSGVDPNTIKAIGIKRPDYLGKGECASRIHYHLPGSKLIVVLRNPVERALSAYFHFMRWGFIPIAPFEEGILKLLKGVYEKDFPRSRQIIEYGFYHKHLARYLELFAKDQIMILLHDDIKLNRLRQLRKSYEFLGVDQNYVPKVLNRRPQASIYSMPRLRFISDLNRLKYQYDSDRSRYTERSLNLLEDITYRLMQGFDWLFLSKIFRASKPKMRAELTKSLFEIYEEDIGNLEILLSRKLDHWHPSCQKR